MGIWKHKPRNKNDKTPDPTESAFFSNEAVGNISNALIREGTQNVLDEIKDSSVPAKIRIFISGKKYAVDPSSAKVLLGDLIPHLQAEKNGIIKSDLPNFNLPMHYLVFEDFNTKGLEGDPYEFEFDSINDSSKPHNFYYFWRAYGRSGKLSNKMGSWGVGKSVFPALSKINCFWALTVRDSDKKSYLIGQSVLKTHNLPDKPAQCGYFPWGDYGLFQEDDFAIPESSLEEIEKFSRLFNLKREIAAGDKDRSKETGVSIVVPFAKAEVTLDTLAYSTIQQFFYPILLNKLEIEIIEEDRYLLLTKDSLKKEIAKLNFSAIPGIEGTMREQLLSLFNFTEWIISLKDTDYFNLTFNKEETAYDWRKTELFKNINLEELQNKFERGEPIAFRIPIKFQPEGFKPTLRYFNAYLMKDDTLADPESIFIRDSLTITGVKSLKRKAVRGIVIISDKDLITFFGQAEGPAHTGWHKDNFRVKYENTDECLSFVKRSLERLYTFLQLPATGLDKSLLKDYFSIDILDDSDFPVGEKADGQKKTKGSFDDEIVARPKKYIVVQLEKESGFKLTNNPSFPEIPNNIKITMAYNRSDANPFKKYSEFDFDIKNLKIEFTNVEMQIKEKNILEFIPTTHDFEVKVTGFDKKRDLIIDVT